MILLKTIKSKIEQAIRLILVNTITKYNNSILIVEYPKSGGTWLGQLVSNYLEIPFPRNKFPSLKRALFHSHYLPKWRITKNKKIIFLVRDGRDVLISLYYHQLLWNNKNKLNPKDVLYHRRKVGFDDFENIEKNIDHFMTHTYESKPSKLTHFTYMGDWFSFNKKWLSEYKKNRGNIYFIKYEDMLGDTYQTMSKLISKFLDQDVNEKKLKEVIYKFSFENQTKRKKGEENKESFLRKGIVGDWKNYFNKVEKDNFKKFTDDLLVELGYEKNTDW